MTGITSSSGREWGHNLSCVDRVPSGAAQHQRQIHVAGGTISANVRALPPFSASDRPASLPLRTPALRDFSLFPKLFNRS